LKLKNHITLLFLALALLGCSQTPRVSIRDYEEQNIGLVAKHWRTLANQTAESLIDKQSLHGKGSVFIATESSDSAFDKAFKDYLTTAFLDKGVPVSKKANSAVSVVNFKAETYLYTKKGEDKSPLNKKTFWAFLYTLNNQLVDMTRGEKEITLLSLGLLWDILDAKNMTSDAEVVLTVTVEDFNSVRYKKSTEFYIERNDLMLYWSDKAPYPAQLTDLEREKQIQPKKIELEGVSKVQAKNVSLEIGKQTQPKKINNSNR